jgi:hypothetical protein
MNFTNPSQSCMPHLQNDHSIAYHQSHSVIPGYPRLIHADQDMRPADVIAKIAPLPLFLTQGTADTVVPPSNLEGLTAGSVRKHESQI